jgi:cytoplasmic iron level regulating protein YaaA (DUF328/UPF0246 family)
MKILLSPAKSIKFDIEAENPLQTQPVFLSEAEKLVKKLKKLKPKHIKTLMKVSDDIAELNYNRFNDRSIKIKAKYSLIMDFYF